MTISITEFKARCLEIFRQMAETGQPVIVERHGKVVGVLYPSIAAAEHGAVDPLDRLIGTGTYDGPPEESVLSWSDFEAMR